MTLARNLPLRHKLTLLVTLTSGLVLGLACLVLVAYDVRRMHVDMERDLRSLASVIGSNSTGALAFNDGRAAGEMLAAMGVKPHIVSGCLYDAGGRPFAVYHRRGAESDPLPAEPLMDTYRRGPAYVRLFQRVTLGEDVAGTLYLKADLEPIRSRTEAYLAVMLLVMLASTAAVSALSTRLQKPITEPVLRLTAAADAVAERKDYSVRVASSGSDEIGRLTVAFNEMLSQIQRRDRELSAEVRDRQTAETALRVSEGKFRSIVETTNEWIWSMDTDGLSTYDNPALERILGHSPQSVRRRSRLDLLHPDDRGRLQDLLPRLMQEKKGFSNLVLRFRHASGDYRILQSSCVPVLDAGGRVTGFQGTDQDITEGRALEEQLRQAQKMDAVGRLAGGVAHDFNNLLGVILGYSEMMLKADLPLALRRKAEQIHKAGERAATLTRQLLAFSRKQVLAPKVIDLNALLLDFAKMLPRVLGEDVTLEIDPAADLGQVKADPGQVEQILMNLAVNARDAMPDGGRIRVVTANAVLDRAFVRAHMGSTEGRYLMLSVADTGCGMDAETQARVFEPFFTTKAPGKGTGLGLATVYGIMKQSEGYIAVESALGVGTTFRLYFPRVDEAVDQPAAAPAPAVRRGEETVLVVEDEADLRELVADMLRGVGHSVLVADCAEAALQASESHGGPIHLLLSDVIMPGMSGRLLARQLTSRRPETKVLYMSGHTDDALGARGVLDPGMHLLSKPFSSDVLARAVRDLLDDRGNGGAVAEGPSAVA